MNKVFSFFFPSKCKATEISILVIQKLHFIIWNNAELVSFMRTLNVVLCQGKDSAYKNALCPHHS